MASEVGVLKVRDVEEYGLDSEFPANNQRNVAGVKRSWPRTVKKFTLDGEDAIGTDDYTFTLWTAKRGWVVEAAWLVSPEEIELDVTNYNTYAIVVSGTTLCSISDAYGCSAYEPLEVRRANTKANRTLETDDVVTLVITGTADGKAIPDGLEVFVVLTEA